MFPEIEQEILEFWRENKIFEKSLEKTKKGKNFRFYDGPPFATGLPHYGHLLAGTIKDVIPRYKTMRGFFVERRFGWDCHGLPVEYEMEKELGISGKKDIEEKIGVEKFNEACQGIVLRYTKEWRETVEKMGRWVDMVKDYKTMEAPFMESIWWVFKTLYEKSLIYEGYKILPYCPRCATPLSNFEANMPGAYKEVKDPAVTVRLKIKNRGLKIKDLSENAYVLIWTTTPWTLPSNVAAAVGPNIDYLIVKDKSDNNQYILAEARLGAYYRNENEYEIVKKLKGGDLVDLKYEPIFPYFANLKNAFKVVAADFVTTADGTGIVHIAPAFGEDDYNLGQKENLPAPNPIDESGQFTAEIPDYEGLFVKDADKKIIEDLKKQGKLIKLETITHAYPHCWRCETPLIYKSISTWFVNVTKIKEKMIKNNKKINWMPEHLKYGRFGKWLEEARDWAISRNRYWGNPIPVWRCERQTENFQLPITNFQINPNSKIQNPKSEAGCGNIKVIGSIKELEELGGQKITDLHKHFVDKITFKCEKCGGKMKRIPEILDCWFESGSMPYAEYHYPFENKKKFEKNFPAQFIAEGIDQTRGWFYTLLVLSTALFNKPAFLNVVVNGLVLAEDGKKMSKRLKNYPEPNEIIDKYGADALRLCLAGSPAAKAEELRFSEKEVREVLRNIPMLLWNVFTFWQTYAEQKNHQPPAANHQPNNILDRWVMAKLNLLIKELTEEMENYDLPKSIKLLKDFINDLSTWYLRRSRERFKSVEAAERRMSAVSTPNDADNCNSALNTLGFVLLETSKLLAPFAPFLSEKIYQNLTTDSEAVVLRSETTRDLVGAEATHELPTKSVHLEDWPEFNKKLIDEKLLKNMQLARQIVSLTLEERANVKIPVRQILQDVTVNGPGDKYGASAKLDKEYLELIKDEVNVKEVKFGSEKTLSVVLNTEITPELRREGIMREIVRQINALRKDAGLTIKDEIILYYETPADEIKKAFEKFGEKIAAAVIAEKIEAGKKEVKNEKTVKLAEGEVWIGF